MGLSLDLAAARRIGHALWRMSRPAFLLGTLPLYLLGAVASGGPEALDWIVALVGLFLVWAIQLATHFNNERRDVEVDRLVDTPTRVSGGSRVLVEGAVPRSVARHGAHASVVAAVSLLALLIGWFDAGRWLPALAGTGLLAGWFYSAPPLALSHRGGGELTAAAVAGLLVPATAYYLQRSTIDPDLLRVCLPIGTLLFALTVSTAIPDVDADRSAGKLTLTARIGTRNAARLQGALWVVGWLGTVVVVSGLNPTLARLTLVGGVPLLLVETRLLPRVARGNVGAAEAVAIGSIATVGLASGVTIAALAS